MAETCTSAYHRISPYATELVHQNVGTDDGVVVDDDFTGQFGAVADDTIVSYKSIMGYMYAFHQQITTAYAGFAFCRRTTVDCYVLTDFVVIADFGCGFFSPEFQILRYGTDNSSRKNDIAVADTCSV